MKFINSKIIIILVLLILLVVGFDLYLINKKGNSSESEKKPVKENKLTAVNKELKELAYDNYIYSYLVQGDVKTSDGYVTVEGITYYAVDDEVLKDINTLEDISALVERLFDGALVSMYLNYFNDEQYNNYIYTDNHLYVKKGSGICHTIAQYDEDIMRFEEGNGENGDKLVVMDEIVVRAVEIDGKYYTTAIEFNCID